MEVLPNQNLHSSFSVPPQNFIFHEGGLYCVESFDKLRMKERQLVTWSVAEVLVCLIDGISNMVVVCFYVCV